MNPPHPKIEDSFGNLMLQNQQLNPDQALQEKAAKDLEHTLPIQKQLFQVNNQRGGNSSTINNVDQATVNLN